jgi:hypothetical protein
MLVGPFATDFLTNTEDDGRQASPEQYFQCKHHQTLYSTQVNSKIDNLLYMIVLLIGYILMVWLNENSLLKELNQRKEQIDIVCQIFNRQYKALEMTTDRWGSHLRIELVPQRDSSTKKAERITFADQGFNFKQITSSNRNSRSKKLSS